MIATSTRAIRPFASASAAFAVVLALSGIVLAGTARLTRSAVEDFIASYPAVSSVVTRHAADRGSKIGSGKEALAAMVEAASSDDIKREIDDAVRPHGFRDAKQWFGVARSVATTYAYLKLDADDEKKRRKLEKAIAKIRKNGFLSDSAKDKVIEALRQNAGMLVIETPPRENVEAVRPMLAAIDGMMK